MLAPTHFAVIACDKRKAFAHGSNATKQSSPIPLHDFWIASLALAMTKTNACTHND
jgi:hypothetical protein